jgi:hypothetical protein
MPEARQSIRIIQMPKIALMDFATAIVGGECPRMCRGGSAPQRWQAAFAPRDPAESPHPLVSGRLTAV